ncbi:PRD domain-containing protein [Konateibacter massiliensis]|uniref:PRD domain-containing protein n=1 Tax=Konateibacter massiliensis TaxID=2002841 RepID=UPI000C15FA2B|nr:PRD domain-containing protein [Konateibacter massiliensis]
MQAIKKINNNVAICVDGNNKELIAFGKGLGFPSMPYEITDLSLISMTFYRIDSRFYSLIQDVPENVFEVSALIVDKARRTLNCNLNPNLIISLADHINFAIVRLKKYKKLQMLFSYDVEQLYPKETELGRFAVKLVQAKLYVKLPESEITNIAMHFVNAEEESAYEEEVQGSEELINEAVEQIEKFFSIQIDRDGFNYNRFVTHMRYYVKRVKEKKQFMDDNASVIRAMKGENPEIYECAAQVADFIGSRLQESSTEDEILYLMIHINRITRNTEKTTE